MALDRRPLDRRYIAGSLWPDSDEERAGGCLRTSLWRLRQAGLHVIDSTKLTLCLASELRVDSEDAGAWAERILAGTPTTRDLIAPPERALDLLPGWYDDWVLQHRERLRHRILHALERVATILSARGDHAQAVDIAGAAVFAEPLRESAQIALVRAHLNGGNAVEARRAFVRFEDALDRELGIQPSDALYRMVGLNKYQESGVLPDARNDRLNPRGRQGSGVQARQHVDDDRRRAAVGEH